MQFVALACIDGGPSLCTAVGGTGVAEMLFCTALVALVGAGEQPAFSPRSLHIANTKVSHGNAGTFTPQPARRTKTFASQ
jgi:autophagy-related protein 18